MALACGGEDSEEFVYSSDSYFAEDYETSYQALSDYDCTQSATHGNDYVRVYVSEEGQPAYAETPMEPGEGAVMVKNQYSDDACETLNAITVMRKNADATDGWEWQRVSASGDVESSGEASQCSGCHSTMCDSFTCADE